MNKKHCHVTLISDLQQMSGDIPGEGVSMADSVSKQITKGSSMWRIMPYILLLKYAETIDTSHHPLNSHLSQASFLKIFTT